MPSSELLSRVVAEPGTCGGKPCIRGTRVDVSIILDSLAEGLSEADILDHFPVLEVEDIRAAAAYAAELARESVWKIQVP